MRDARKMVSTFFAKKPLSWFALDKELLNLFGVVVSKLYENEEVIDFVLGLDTQFYLFTNQNYIFICYMEARKKEGIFSQNDYVYYAHRLDLNEVSKDKVKMVRSGTFGFGDYGIKFDTTYNEQDAIIIWVRKEKELQPTLAKVLNHVKKYKRGPISKPVVDVNIVSSNINTTPQKKDSNTGNIQEIRKLYEDGIISKEEMMELLKDVLKK